MKKKFAAVCVAACAAALCFSACGSEPIRSSVSYLSVQTEVYSSTAEVVREVADSVVEISTESVTAQFGMQYIVSGAGSGVIVGKTGEDYLIVTNNHVVEGANEITVRTREGKRLEAALVAADDSVDIAVVSVSSDEELKLAVWGNSDDLQTGETVIAIGNPLGNLGGTVTQGILSATSRTIAVDSYSMRLLQTDAAINPGNSGGGLFNMRGELVGVVNAKSNREGVEGLCFAIPSNTARTAYEDLNEYGYLVGRSTLHIRLAEGSAAGSGGQTQTVVYLSAVEENADGNFRRYDRLAEINGVKIDSLLAYHNVMAGIRPNDKVEVTVYRGSVVQSVFGGSLSFESSPTVFTATAAQYGA